MPGFGSSLILTLWRHKVLFSLLYFGVIGTAVSLFVLASPKYEVSSVISVQPGLYNSDADKPANGSQRQEIKRSQIALLESEDVIRQAMAAVGSDRVALAGVSPFGVVKEFLGVIGVDSRVLEEFIISIGVDTARFDRASMLSDKPLSSEDEAYLVAKESIRVEAEPFTNLIRISFRHTEPEVAVEFTNALVQSFTRKHFDLFNSASAVSFFLEKQAQSDAAFARASAALSKFASSNQAFDVGEQRELLLRHRSALKSDLIKTRGAIVEKENKQATIPDQLDQMKPIVRYPQIAGLASRIRERKQNEQLKEKYASNSRRGQNPRALTFDRLASNPPLLLLRVYQETVASLVKLHTDLAGLRALEAFQESELKKVDEELGELSAKEAEFERLRADVDRARRVSEFVAKRAYEEQLAQDLNAEKLSSIQIIQRATRPLKPIWSKGLILMTGLLLCLLPLFAWPSIYRVIAAEREYRKKNSKCEHDDGVTDNEFLRRRTVEHEDVLHVANVSTVPKARKSV